MMDQRIDLPLPFGQGAGTAKEFLESFVKSVANALALIIEQIGGIPPQVRWRILYQSFCFMESSRCPSWLLPLRSMLSFFSFCSGESRDDGRKMAVTISGFSFYRPCADR